MWRTAFAFVVAGLVGGSAAVAQPEARPPMPPEPAEAPIGGAIREVDQREDVEAPVEQDLSLTVYSTADPAQFDPQQFIAQQRMGYDPNFVWQVPGFGVVKRVESVAFDEGMQEIAFTDVAQFIDPTTVSFLDLQSPEATTVLEQQFKFDLVSPEKLVENYLGREITLMLPREDGTYEPRSGTLLSATQGHFVLENEGEGVELIPRNGDVQVQLGELPGGLITKPTLLWLVNSEEAGARPVRTTYQTGGITWQAAYNLVLAEDEQSASLGAWVTLMNLSGASYPDAKLKLIAGDVQRIQPPRPEMMHRRDHYAMEMAAADAGFEEKPFFEYHLYTLPRRTTVHQNSTQQITLFPTAHDVNVEKVLVYYGLPEAAQWGTFPKPRVDRDLGGQSNTKVDVYVQFDNAEENSLGVPLPRGKMRVYKEDQADGTLEFVGEDLIDHTPRNEEVLIKLGQAFDVVGERTQVDFSIDQRAHTMTETFRIQVRNHKDEPVTVQIRENLYRWTNWEIVEASDEWEKVDARTIHFPVEVPAGGEKTVTYTVRYTW